jgi:bacterioferritin
MLKQFFESEVPEELGHAQFLADKVASLGGSPVTVAREVPPATSPKEMLENVQAAERQAIADYKERSEQALELGEKGLATRLETIVEDETEHFEETAKILRGWGG